MMNMLLGLDGRVAACEDTHRKMGKRLERIERYLMLSRIDRMKMLPEFQYKEQLNIFMRILYWLRELLGSIDFQAIELQGASLSAVLGIVLFNPFVDTFSTGRGYAAMAGLFSEYTWGAILFVQRRACTDRYG
jgi:hypothetical protein